MVIKSKELAQELDQTRQAAKQMAIVTLTRDGVDASDTVIELVYKALEAGKTARDAYVSNPNNAGTFLTAFMREYIETATTFVGRSDEFKVYLKEIEEIVG